MGVKSSQLRSFAPRSHLKAIAMAWFENYRPTILASSCEFPVGSVDAGFKALLTASEKAASTSKVRAVAKQLQTDLVQLQTIVVSAPIVSNSANDSVPSFSAIPDPVMRQVLQRRWHECVTCLEALAPLAATVMMGGLLESLFLARINREPNKQAIFTAKAAPKDLKTQQTLSLKEWTLKDYIAVAHELGWIPQAVHDVSQILRDYRNYIHPQKELTHQLSLTVQDAQMFWDISKAIAARLGVNPKVS